MALMPNMNTYVTNRLIVYLVISALTALQGQLALIREGDYDMTRPVVWVLLFVNVLLPIAITIRTFIDQSMSEGKGE